MNDLKKTTVRGTEIHYQDIGQGEPVVLVHGSLGDYRSWSLQFDAFAASHRVISYSRRYHFPNAWPDDGPQYSADVHADDLAALLDHWQIDRAHVVSASYGSCCALVFAQRHLDRVSSLIVAEPPILSWVRELPGGPEMIQPFIENAWNPCRDAFLRGANEEAVRLFIDGVVGRPGAFASFHLSIRQSLMDNAREMKAECLSDRMFPHFRCEEAAAIAIPTLLLSGERSPAFFRRITEELARCLPHGHVVEFNGVSHNFNTSRPKLYNQVVLDFLSGHYALQS